MTSDTSVKYYHHPVPSTLTKIGYAMDYPVHGNLHRLTYEELHTFSVLVTNTIHLIKTGKDQLDKIRELEQYIGQYDLEGQVIYHLVREYFPEMEVQHNVIKRMTEILRSGRKVVTSNLQYFSDVKNGLSKILDQEFQYVTIHPKILSR